MQNSVFVFLFSILTVLHGQVRPREFDAAVIRPAAPDAQTVKMDGGPGSNDPTRIRYVNVDLASIVTLAFNIKRFQLDAPRWMDNERFDVQAVMPDGVDKSQFSEMLKNLLVEHFHIAFRVESRTMPAYRLTVGKHGHRMQDLSGSSRSVVREPKPVEISQTPIDANGFPVLDPGEDRE